MSPRRRLALCTAIVAAFAALPEARRQTAPGTGLIVGHVVDGVSGAPIGGVIVALAATATTPSFAGPTRVMTGADGGFVFSGLAAAAYTLRTIKAGYANGAFGQRRPGGDNLMLSLVDGQSVTDASVRMWKFASITGAVVDDAGDPVVGIAVRVLRRSWVAGRQRLVNAAPVATTDDRGVYAFSSLVPGTYVVSVPATQTTLPGALADEYVLIPNQNAPVKASVLGTAFVAPPGNALAMRVGDFVLQRSSQAPILSEPNARGELAVYPTAFYPNTPGSAQAGGITLGPGEERTDADLRLRAVTSVRVSGTVRGPDGPAAIQIVRLIPQAADELTNESGFETGVTLTDAHGAFTFLGMPPGPYVLRVRRIPGAEAGAVHDSMPAPVPTEPTLWADESVTVGDRDVTLAVALSVGARVSGRFEFQGAAPRPSSDRLQQILVTIDPVDGRDAGSPPAGHGDSAGAFATYGIPAGRYLVRVANVPAAWTLKSAMLGGKDLSETPLELRSTDVAGVVITFTDQPTQLTGTVTNPQGAPDVNASVLVFPADSSAWADFGSSARRIRSARASASGTYTIAELPPGDYCAVAMDDEAAGDWQQPSSLEKLSRVATRFTLIDAQKLSLSLRTVVIR